MSDAKTTLAQSAPFHDFDIDIIDVFFSRAREKEFRTGEVLFHEMSEGDEIYLILDGKVRISVEIASAHHMTEEIKGGKGDLVGEGRFITEGTRPATVTAASDLTVLVWDVADWYAIADEYPSVGYRLAVFAGKVLFARVCELRNHLINDISWGLE